MIKIPNQNSLLREVFDILPDFCWVSCPDVEKMLFVNGTKTGSDSAVNSCLRHLYRNGLIIKRGERGFYQYLKTPKGKRI